MLEKKYLGKLIRKARQYKSKNINKPFTQQMLADEIGKSRSYICDMERGRTYPSYPTLSSIAQACNLPLDFFQDNNEVDNTLNKFIELQLEDLNKSEVNGIGDSFKKEQCKNPEDIIKYIIQSKPILDFYEIEKENSKDFANEVINQINLISYKYKK